MENKIDGRTLKFKPVYVYNTKKELFKFFESTQECAAFFGKPSSYIISCIYRGTHLRHVDGKDYIFRRKRL